MAPQRLHTKHRIVQPAPSKPPFSEVYYKWSLGEEDAIDHGDITKAAGDKIKGGGEDN